MKLLKEIGRAFFVGVIVFLGFGIFRYVNGDVLTSGKELLILFLYNQMYALALYLANAYFFNFLVNYFKAKFYTLKNVLIGLIGAVLVTISVILVLRFITEVVIEGESFAEFIQGEKIEYYYGSFLISILVTLIIYLIFYYRHRQETKVKEQKIIAGTASAKFDALKNQLDPHFLFNSLNVLTSLIEENPEAATQFTTALSKVYRYVLEQKNKELVTVEEELRFANLYISLLKMRFEDSIVFTTPEQISNPEAKVVPLSLQLLLENAVKHNQVTPTNQLHITVFEETGNLVVKNNIQPKTVMKESSGVGLFNIKHRYQLLTDREVKINKTEKEFSVALPMLTKMTQVMQTQEYYISEKRYDRAKKHVEQLKGFYIHLFIYLVMVPVFILINSRTTSFPWAIFPIFGWGLGIAGHAMETFNYNPFLGRNWEEKKIKELMDMDDF